MTNEELEAIAAALRAEHHSEVRWTHGVCTQLIAEIRSQQARISALESAIRSLIVLEDWPRSPERERTFAQAGMLISEEL